MNSSRDWYVIRTGSRAEKKVLEALESKNFEAYLPQYETIRIWSDRKKKVKVPLIPGHVFVFLTQNELKEVYSIQGVKYLLSEAGKPAIVRPVEIQNLRALSFLELNPEFTAMTSREVGDEIEVMEGPFKGLTGIVTKATKSVKVHLLFPQLGLSVVLKQNVL